MRLFPAASNALVLTLDGQFNPPEATIFSASSESLECVEIARRAGRTWPLRVSHSIALPFWRATPDGCSR